MAELQQIFVHVAYGRGSVLLWRRCDTLCMSDFMDDVNFLYRGANGPESSTTLFSKVRQMALPVLQLQCLVEFVRMWHRGQNLLSTIVLLPLCSTAIYSLLVCSTCSRKSENYNWIRTIFSTRCLNGMNRSTCCFQHVTFDWLLLRQIANWLVWKGLDNITKVDLLGAR